MTMNRTLVAVATLALTMTGCGGDGADDPVTVLRVVTGSADGGPEYRFEGPDEVTAGPARVVLRNEGGEPHHAQVFRLNERTTVSDLESALAEGEPAGALEVGTFLGGTGLVSPGEDSRADAVLDLAPGDYALLCFVPGEDGAPHVAHGMVHPFEVTEAGDRPEPPPTEAEVRLVDYGFELPDRVEGDDTLAITNDAAREAHEMVVGRLPDDVEAGDVVQALNDGAPLPAVGVGGMQAILPGTTQRLRLDLAPGRYVVLCAVTSPNGRPHYAAGMIEEVRVR